MNPFLIFIVIIGYALLMQIFKVTKYQFNSGWQSCLLDIFTIAIPVAIFEEMVFRYLIYFKLLLPLAGNEIALWGSALFFSLTHFLWGMYRGGGEYGTVAEISLLTIGLTLFGAVCAKYFWLNGSNIVFHAMSIYAVQILNKVTINEGKKNLYLYDNGHQLLRAPFIWIILLVWYNCI